MKSFFTVVALLLSLAAHSKQPNKNQLASEFYKNLLKPSSIKTLATADCEPRPDIGSCVKSVCNKLSPFGCDDESELKQVVNICRGNFGGSCIDTTCGYLSPFYCRSIEDLTQVARSCAQVYNNSCSQFFTSHLSPFDYDDMIELLNINDQCKNISPEVVDCAEFLCSKLTRSSCDDFDELKDTLKTCSGQ